MDRILAVGLLLALAAAAGLEGGVEHRYGGPAMAVAAAFAVGLVLRGGVARPGRVALVGILLLAVPIGYALLPVPPALRAVVAPGQAAWFARVGEPAVTLEAWLTDLTQQDVAAAVGEAREPLDLLAGAQATGVSPGALDPTALPWELGTLAACVVVYAAGTVLARDERTVRFVALTLVVFGVVESLLGLRWKDGPTVGLAPKEHYLGSATGTFVNRGHFAAFLLLAIGSAWGLAASLFPLEPEEVRKHRARKRRSSHPPGLLEYAGDKLPRLVLLAFGAGLLALALVASQSRGPLVALLVASVGVGAWALWRRQDRTHLGIGLVVPLAGLVLAAVAVGPRAAIGRFLTLGTDDVSVSARRQMWAESLEAWLDAPVFGTGPGGWHRAWTLHEVAPHLYSSRYAHSEPVQVLVELGAVGALGAVLVLGAWGWHLRKALDVAEEGPHLAHAIGWSVPVVAILLQSGADFPLHTPGVGLGFALVAGLVVGCLDPAPARRHRLAPAGLGIVGIVLLGVATVHDLRAPGTRAQRLSEETELNYARDPRTVPEARAWLADAQAAVHQAPLDPWRHAAVAHAASLLALDDPDGDPTELAFQSQLAAARALALRRHDPRLQVSLADAELRLLDVLHAPDALTTHATALLAQAVHDDSWRASDAFRIAGSRVSHAQLQAMADAAPDDPLSKAHIWYELGRAFEARGEKADAMTAHETASNAYPDFGAPAFNMGILLHHAGDDAGASAWFERFLSARDRSGAMEGWAYHFLGRYPEAEARFRKVVQEQPQNRWAWQGLADTCKARGERADERHAVQKMLELSPDDPGVRKRLEALEKPVSP